MGVVRFSGSESRIGADGLPVPLPSAVIAGPVAAARDQRRVERELQPLSGAGPASSRRHAASP